MSNRRVVVLVGGCKDIDLPLDHPLRATLEVTVERGPKVRFTYDAGRFHESRSGYVDVRLRTPLAGSIAELVLTPR